MGNISAYDVFMLLFYITKYIRSMKKCAYVAHRRLHDAFQQIESRERESLYIGMGQY